jgi:hypothetical protein
MSRRTAFVAATTVMTAALALVATPALAADPASGSAGSAPGSTTTITVDTAKLEALCQDRLPKVQARVEKALTRVQADASTKGSAAWVRARADQASAEGHDDLARRLQFRADQRLGHVDELTTLQARLAGVASGICSQVQP